MAWAQDRQALLQWVCSGLVASVVALLTVLYTNLNATAAETAAMTADLKARYDHSEGKVEIEEQLLREVRQDVKDIKDMLAKRTLK